MRSGAVGRFSPQVAAVIQHSLTGEGQTETDAVLASSGKWLKQALTDFLRDAWSRVIDTHQNFRAGPLRSDFDAPAVWHGFNGVVDQIDEYTLHPGALGWKFDLGIHVLVDLHTMFRRGGGLRFDSSTHHFAQTADFRRMNTPARDIHQFLQQILDRPR